MEIPFPKLEKKILKLWKENSTFEKSIQQRKKAPNFVFYEGPPTANGRPGLHHVLSRVFKDIICRYKTMQGFLVLRKAGWDTHGLPVELEIEKKLGLKSKKDIEKFGIARFNKLSKQSVWQYQKDWENLTERIAFWLDMKNPYITYENNYLESLWWIIKQIYQKGLIYQGYKVVPYCPRCGTSLSSHEVALGYKNIKELAIYVKFKIKPKSYLLVWTTTPWTLPGNVAVAINPKFTYVKVKLGDENLILAKERMASAGVQGEVVQEFPGKDLLGLKYEPLFKSDIKDAYRVVSGNFVSLEEGTGLVHIAPAFGEEDLDVGKKNNLPVLLNVDEEGKFKSAVKPWAGRFVQDANPLIIEDLKKKNLLFKEEKYLHDYPFCWRCDSALLYYAKENWFINMQKIKKDLIANNQKINWVPGHLKEGRFGEWLKEVKDWVITRERYWGTPLPIWRCRKCGEIEVVGSKKDLISQKFSKNRYFLLRHGESLRQIKNLAMCWPEKIHCPLTKKGEKQVQAVVKEVQKKKIDLIFASDLLRTKQTAQIIAKELKLRVVYDKRLREFNVGIFNGKDPKKVWEYVGGGINIFSQKAPQGESWTDMKKRMYSFLKDINKKYSHKNILIVSHEAPLSLLEATLKGMSNEEVLKWRGKNHLAVGEIREIAFSDLPYNEKMELDFHRPYIDEVKFQCPKCQEGLMERFPEVIDCWFDSGSMPLAQHHYPFEKRIQFPADYISEAIDQTRGWFYTLLAVATLLGLGKPYKNVISLGHVLDEKGEKMSKSKGNVVDPWYIVEKYGADATRWYFYTVNQPGDPKLFSEKDIDQALKKFIMTLWNSYLFFETYKGNSKLQNPKSTNVLDKWIISRLNGLIQEVTQKLDKYDVTGSARAIENFVINDLSLWYIRRSRKRFKEASTTLGHILLTLSKLTAPFTPFISEEIHQGLKSDFKPSVHLEDWPKANKKLINKKLEEEMAKVREIVTLALGERAKTGIRVRQPLASLQIPEKIDKELLDLLKEEVNVKEITFGRNLKLDTKITPALKEEGIVREVIRQIQEMRKKAGLKPKDKILVQYRGTGELNKILTKNKLFILKQIKAKDFRLAKKPGKAFDIGQETKVEQQNLWLAIKKV